MIFYITRPTAYEIYMGGKRSLQIWVEEPSYSHASREHDTRDGKPIYADVGWTAPHSAGTTARFVLSQDSELLANVWREIFISILPKGLSYEEGIEWQSTPIDSDVEGDTAYRYLFSDKSWEGKCNTCKKRLLLQINVKTNEVKRISPFVENRRLSLEEPYAKMERTDQCDPFFATEYYHETLGVDDIPF